MDWSEGRRLTSVTYHPTYQQEGKTTAYEYSQDGMRTKKIRPDGSDIQYHLANGKAIGETFHDASGAPYAWMRYLFDENGAVCGISYWGAGETKWSEYYFAKNLQGDVTQVYRASDNALVAEYEYDSWGNILSQSGYMADINPFRYRSCYFDPETGFYYLQSRYYDPQIGRFINADSYASTGQGFLGCNMFAYCNNNPANRIDPSGHAWKDIADWFSDAFDKTKKVVNKVTSAVKKGAYSIYYNATKWHFEGRETRNGSHPSYTDVTKKDSGWRKITQKPVDIS